MNGTESLPGAIGNSLWFLGEVMFTWVPASVMSITSSAQSAAEATSTPLSAIAQPVAPSDVFTYLQQISSPSDYAILFQRWSEFVAVSITLSLVLLAAVVYCAMRIIEVRKHEMAKFEAAAHTVAARDIPKTHLRWEHILEETAKDDERNWRLAILEADIMLNELLDTLGYRGETMADKMKHVERADFRTIDLAWEAHKVRNAIAHEGSAHILTQREARRVIGLYEQVFREFKFIG